MLKISQKGNCLVFDFSELPTELNTVKLKKSCIQKDKMHCNLSEDGAEIRLILTTNEFFTFDFTRVSEVGSVAPTSNEHLFELLTTLYSS